MKIYKIAGIIVMLSGLAGCSAGPTYHASGQVSRIAPPPLVQVPRVSGSSAGGNIRATSSTVIGNHQTPARVNINARTTLDGGCRCRLY